MNVRPSSAILQGILIHLVIIVLALFIHCNKDNGNPVQVQTPPKMSISSDTLTFLAVDGGSDPQSKVVSVMNGGGGNMDGLVATILYTNGSGWLSAGLNSTIAPATLTIHAMIRSLTPGTYKATVVVSASSIAAGSRNIDVTLIVLIGVPVLAVSPSDINFTAQQGGVNPLGKSVDIFNNGGGSITGLSTSITYGSGANWLTASLNSTTAPAKLTLEATSGPLAAGTYLAQVHVASPSATNSPVTISVTLNVSSTSPSIKLSTSSVAFTAQQGGSNPGSQIVNVSNGGGGSLTGLSTSISYSSGSGWLSATLNSTTAPANLTIQATTGSLAAGTYNATVSVASAVAGNSPRTVSVSFTVGSTSPSITLSTSSLAFTAQQGGSNPASQIVNVSNGGGGSLTGLSTSISYSSGSGWLSATLSSTTAPANLTIQATTGSLSAGTYNATVSVASAVAGNSPRTVSVSFTVTAVASPLIVLSDTVKEFTLVAGTATKYPEPVTVTNGGGGTLSDLATSVNYGSGSGWMNAILNSTTAPATISLSVAAGNLTPGIYTANVLVSSPVAANSPKKISITATITAPVEVEKTYFASYDNLLMDNSHNPLVADSVYQGGPLGVGTDYFYRMNGSYDFIAHASLFKFNLQSEISGKTIDTAIVSLYEYILPGDPIGIFEFAAIATGWNPATVTWNVWVKSMKYYDSPQLYFNSLGTTSVAHTFEVTAIVRGWANGSLSNNGFQIWEPYPAPPGYESYQSTEIQSLEVYWNFSHRPQIYIRYH